MLKDCTAFSGFSVDDEAAAKTFYSEVLGLEVEQDGMGLTLKITGGNDIFAYPKKDHVPATFTILNFQVTDIDAVQAELEGKGVAFERYPEMPQDDKGILRGRSQNMGPDIAWFKDPAGNILAILQS